MMQHSTSGCTHKRIESRDLNTYFYTSIHGSIIFTIAKGVSNLCPLTDEWISKMWYIHTKGYYSAFKKKEILVYPTAWMNLEDIMLSVISQTH